MFTEKLVTIGGGTGTHTLLSGLKKFPFSITSIVTVADSGGSTGRLRDEFGALPVGDFRMALTALASGEEESNILRQLFLYRFDRGSDGLRGHNFGNLFLVAMADILGSYDKAIKYTSEILNVRGRVLPVTNMPVDLFAEYEDGSVIKGEALIDTPIEGHDGKKKIIKLWSEPYAPIDVDAMQAILDADYIIFGPGDLYTSILPNIIVDGTAAALCKTNAKLIYVMNLVTKYGQTHEFTAKTHVDELTKYVGKGPDFVLINSETLPTEVLENYKIENAFPVVDDLLQDDVSIRRASIIATTTVKSIKGDSLHRSLLRHDSDKLAWEIVKIVTENALLKT